MYIANKSVASRKSAYKLCLLYAYVPYIKLITVAEYLFKFRN